MSDRWLQRWSFATNSYETFVFEDQELIRKIRELFHKKCWNFRDVSEIEVWFLDMQTNESELILLCAGLNMAHTPQMFYAFVTITIAEDHCDVKDFLVLKLTMFYSNELEKECLSMKFILNRNTAYIYADKTIYPIYFNGKFNYIQY